MKSAAAFTVTSALAGQAAAQFAGLLGGLTSPAALDGITGIVPAGMLSSVSPMFLKTVANPGYGKTFGMLSTRQVLTPRQSADHPGSQSVRLRYGPYSVPGMTAGVMEKGSLWNYPDTDVQKPCSTCTIIGMNADLDLASTGNVINVDEGGWLHHFVLFVQGPGRVDATCTGKASLPHGGVGTDPEHAERMFSSGNERTPAFIGHWIGQNAAQAKPVGYHLNAADRFHLIVDLMNENSATRNFYLVINFDYLDGENPNYDHMRPVWFDIKQCGTSEVYPTQQSGRFSIPAYSWYSNVDGEILGYAGHLHDGGQSIDLTMNGQKVCTSEAIYGANAKYRNTAMEPGMAKGSAMVHISNMTICQGSNLNQRYMKSGQNWLLTANYDYSKNAGMLDENGRQDFIMGIAIMYVRVPYRKASLWRA